MTQKIKIIFAICLLMLVFANFSQAALVNCGSYNENGTRQSDCTLGSLIDTVGLIINFLLSWAWLVSILFIVVSGIRMVLSGGNEERLSSAKASLSNAIIGFILILLSFVIINLVIGLFTGGSTLGPNAFLDAFRLIPR